MKAIMSFEPVDSKIIGSIINALGLVGTMVSGMNDVDMSAGCGIIDGRTRCLWTKEGHRIEVWYSDDGGFGAAKSKEIDPP